MKRKLLATAVFAATVLGCTVPAATERLLDVAIQGVDQAIANADTAKATVLQTLDAQQEAILAAAEGDLRGLAEAGRVKTDDAVELLRATYQQVEILEALRTRMVDDGRVATDNLQAVRELLEDARRLVRYSYSLTDSLDRYTHLLTGGEPPHEQTD